MSHGEVQVVLDYVWLLKQDFFKNFLDQSDTRQTG